jgi:uncharacterized protein (TIGR02058 family)
MDRTHDAGGHAMAARPQVLEFGMGVDLHGNDPTKAARRAVFDAMHHSSLPLLSEVERAGGRMLVAATVGVPEPERVDVASVANEFPHGTVTVEAVNGGLLVPGGETIIACAAITVSVEYPE